MFTGINPVQGNQVSITTPAGTLFLLLTRSHFISSGWPIRCILWLIRRFYSYRSSAAEIDEFCSSLVLQSSAVWRHSLALTLRCRLGRVRSTGRGNACTESLGWYLSQSLTSFVVVHLTDVLLGLALLVSGPTNLFLLGNTVVAIG